MVSDEGFKPSTMKGEVDSSFINYQASKEPISGSNRLVEVLLAVLTFISLISGLILPVLELTFQGQTNDYRASEILPRPAFSDLVRSDRPMPGGPPTGNTVDGFLMFAVLFQTIIVLCLVFPILEKYLPTKNPLSFLSIGVVGSTLISFNALHGFLRYHDRSDNVNDVTNFSYKTGYYAIVVAIISSILFAVLYFYNKSKYQKPYLDKSEFSIKSKTLIENILLITLFILGAFAGFGAFKNWPDDFHFLIFIVVVPFWLPIFYLLSTYRSFQLSNPNQKLSILFGFISSYLFLEIMSDPTVKVEDKANCSGGFLSSCDINYHPLIEVVGENLTSFLEILLLMMITINLIPIFVLIIVNQFKPINRRIESVVRIFPWLSLVLLIFVDILISIKSSKYSVGDVNIDNLILNRTLGFSPFLLFYCLLIYRSKINPSISSQMYPA